MFLTEFLTSVVLCVGLGAASVQWGFFHGAPFAPVLALLLCYATATVSPLPPLHLAPTLPPFEALTAAQVPFLYFASGFFRSAPFAAQATALALLAGSAAFVALDMQLPRHGKLAASVLPPLALQYGIMSFFSRRPGSSASRFASTRAPSATRPAATSWGSTKRRAARRLLQRRELRAGSRRRPLPRRRRGRQRRRSGGVRH